MDEYIEIQPKTFRFGQVGDYVAGTLTEVSKTTSPDKWGKYSHIYSILTDEGVFLGSTKDEKTSKYKDNKEPTTIGKDEQYTVFINDDKGVVIGKMKDIKIGQKFKIQFTEIKPTTKGNDAKIIKVFAGPMNEEYLKAQSTPAENYEQM